MNANDLRQAMAKLPEPVTALQPPHWEYWRWELWKLAQEEDVARFWLWPCIYHTMLSNHWPNSIDYEYLNLPEELINACKISLLFGPRDPFYRDTTLSMNLIHQAYHIHQWQEFTGQKVADLTHIIEFGGGYGAMALLCPRLGFKGLYTIYDLPEFSLLQRWYLDQVEVNCTIEWPTEFEQRDADLLIALYSLSECPVELRTSFFAKVSASSYLFLYSGQWEEYDNVSYFQYNAFFQNSYPNLKWRHTELGHLPDKNNWYSLGVWRE